MEEVKLLTGTVSVEGQINMYYGLSNNACNIQPMLYNLPNYQCQSTCPYYTNGNRWFCYHDILSFIPAK